MAAKKKSKKKIVGLTEPVILAGEKKKKHIDFEQEYLGMFTTSKGAAFQPVSSDDYTIDKAVDLATLE